MAINSTTKKKTGLTVRKATSSGAYETNRGKIGSALVKGTATKTGGAIRKGASDARRKGATLGAVKGVFDTNVLTPSKKKETATKKK
jgi:hypothetical protein